MRIVFYLPVVTPAWLDTIVLPLIRVAARDADVHVIVPARWAGTGIDDAQRQRHAAIPRTTWHHPAGAHAGLRTGGAGTGEVVRLVQALAPDYTLCRSADIATPQRFPGTTAFLMEGDFPPLPERGRVRLSTAAIFDHGVMPALAGDRRRWLADRMRGLHDAIRALRRDAAPARARFLARHDLPADRPIVAMPLEHDGADNFFMLHSPAPVNATCVREVAAALGDRCVLALTVHPAQRADRAAMARLDALRGPAIHILDGGEGEDVTPALARHCDAMILRDSKSFVWPALFGKPVLRISRFASGAWLHGYAELSRFDDALRTGDARAPTLAAAMAWLGFRLANDLFLATDPAIDLARLIGRIERPVDRDRWDHGMATAQADLHAAAAAIHSVGA